MFKLPQSISITMSGPLQQFGGNWTDQKLQKLRNYLLAYTEALKNQPFTLYYIDAFAGTGYNTPKGAPDFQSPLFDDLAATDTREFLDGSARIALQIPRPFDQYIFIEQDPGRCAELDKLKSDFPSLKSRITPINAEANDCLVTLCNSRDWLKENCRAVIFLDPFGMQVSWKTIAATAATKAVDLWLLFPLGIGVNRMLPKNGVIPIGWRKRLDLMFGESSWYSAFYEIRETPSLFGEKDETAVKRADYDAISRYFVERLKTVFPYVAENPLPLMNSSNCPLYLLCFAAGNPGKGGAIAKRIAKHILTP
ncbi:MAG: three-Cys-motif partner protein TcmP [Limisphaerales bacterium]